MIKMRMLPQTVRKVLSQSCPPRLLALASVVYGALAVLIESLISFQNRPRLIFNLVIAAGGLVLAVAHPHKQKSKE